MRHHLGSATDDGSFNWSQPRLRIRHVHHTRCRPRGGQTGTESLLSFPLFFVCLCVLARRADRNWKTVASTDKFCSKEIFRLYIVVQSSVSLDDINFVISFELVKIRFVPLRPYRLDYSKSSGILIVIFFHHDRGSSDIIIDLIFLYEHFIEIILVSWFGCISSELERKSFFCVFCFIWFGSYDCLWH